VDLAFFFCRRPAWQILERSKHICGFAAPLDGKEPAVIFYSLPLKELSINNLYILPCLFAAMWRGKTMKGSKHPCGSPTPHDNKNPAAFCTTYLLTDPNGSQIYFFNI